MIRIYVEGDKALRPGFRAFFAKVIPSGLFHVVAARGTPGRIYEIGCVQNPECFNILLRDSEGPRKPETDRLIFQMVQMMESWFLADHDLLENFYGRGFQRSALKPNTKVEEISKKDVLDGLKSATRGTPKGTYHKTAHAPELLARIDPQRVRQCSPECHRLLTTLEEHVASSE